MIPRRKSIDDPSRGKDKSLQKALLKLSTANAFAKSRQASGASGSMDVPPSAPSNTCEAGSSGSGPPFSLDDMPSAEPSPEQLSPYYGLYAEYEDVMELLHTAQVADGSCRRQLLGLARQQVVHVAHLGLGACCSVDLVALHTADGSRLLAAAKSCFLPPADPRMRASLREAELLRRCADCPFIMQLLAVVQETPEAAGPGAAWGGGGSVCGGGVGGGGVNGSFGSDAGTCWAGGGESVSPSSRSPHDSMRQDSLLRESLHRRSVDHALGSGGLVGSPPTHAAQPAFSQLGVLLSGGEHAGGLDAQAQAQLAAQLAAMQGSPAYQAWVQWRGGGTAEDLQRQLLSRLSAAGSLRDSVTGSGGAGGGSFSLGGLRVGSTTGDFMGTGLASPGSFTIPAAGWDAASPRASFNGGAYGGGWTFGGGAGGGAVGSDHGGHGSSSDSCAGGHDGGQAPAPRRRPPQRRASLEVIEMYRGCSAMRNGGPQGPAASHAHAHTHAHAHGGHEGDVGPGAGSEAPVMTTLLLGWARCGDLRRLVQLLMSRSPQHAAQHKHGGHGGAGAVAGLPPLMPEEAARFYAGCLVLALEHLHGRMHTVHRDLKLANLLLLSSGYAVVGDLGTAVDLGAVPGGRLNARVGSPGHMAPECRDRDEAGYDTSADMWSLGACLYSLLTGHLPAGTSGPPGRAWSPPLSRHWSRELQDLLGRLLAWSPELRPSAAQLLRDPWFRGFDWRALRAQSMPPPSSTPWRELLWWPKENRHLL